MTTNYEKILPLFAQKYGSLDEFQGSEDEYIRLMLAFAHGWGARDTARTSTKIGRPKGKRSLPKGKKADK